MKNILITIFQVDIYNHHKARNITRNRVVLSVKLRSWHLYGVFVWVICQIWHSTRYLHVKAVIGLLKNPHSDWSVPRNYCPVIIFTMVFWRILVFWKYGLLVRIPWAGITSKDIWKDSRRCGLPSPIIFNTFDKNWCKYSPTWNVKLALILPVLLSSYTQILPRKMSVKIRLSWTLTTIHVFTLRPTKTQFIYFEAEGDGSWRWRSLRRSFEDNFGVYILKWFWSSFFRSCQVWKASFLHMLSLFSARNLFCSN